MILSTISSLDAANAAALQLPIARLRRRTLAGCDSANKACFGSFAIQSACCVKLRDCMHSLSYLCRYIWSSAPILFLQEQIMQEQIKDIIIIRLCSSTDTGKNSAPAFWHMYISIMWCTVIRDHWLKLRPRQQRRFAFAICRNSLDARQNQRHGYHPVPFPVDVP
jgi:hypothetical protein